MKPSNNREHIIVGSGVMGLLTAWYLHKEGQQVTIIERGEVGRESSWAGGGILSPLFPWRYPQAVTDLVQWSQAIYPGLCTELSQLTGIDPEWTQSGMLIIDHEQQLAAEWSQQTHTKLNFIDSEAIRQLEPCINNTFGSAMWMPQVAQVRNPRLVKSLKQALVSNGVEIIEHAEVTTILISGDHVQGVQTNHGSIHGNKVVISSGAWSANLLKPFVTSIDVEPVRGQMLLIEAAPELIHHIILADEHYVIPRRDGKILVGSTLEYVGFDKNTTPAAKNMLRDVAINIAPCLSQYKIINHWAGLRPGSRSNVPTISEHPQIKDLFINAGHFRNGVVMAPASANLMVDLLLDRHPIFNPMFYNLKSP